MSSHLNLRRIFNRFNRLYFNNEVPAETRVRWAPLNGNSGEYQAGGITIDVAICSMNHAKIVLLHEMIHARYPQYTHGKKFQAELDRLYAAGAYKGLL